MSKTWDDLDVGDYLLYDGTPAIKFTAANSIYIPAGVLQGVRHNIDHSLVWIEQDILTQAELNELTPGLRVVDADGVVWTKKKVGLGSRWEAPGKDNAIAADIAMYGPKTYTLDPQSAFTVETRDAVLHSDGSWTLLMNVMDGAVVGASFVAKIDPDAVFDAWLRKEYKK